MTKILITSDWHLDAMTAGVARVSEFDHYLHALIERARAEAVDIVLVLGDYFDPGGMNAHEMTARLFGAARDIAEVAPVIFIGGNHDVVESSDGWTTLSPLRVASENGFAAGRVFVYEKPGVFTLIERDGSASVPILALPYVARSVEATEDFQRLLAAVFQRAAEFAGDIVVAGHLTVPGAVISSESKEMARGRDVEFPFQAVAELQPRLVVNGHYHRAQEVKGPHGVTVRIPGSPARLTFGERDDEMKGFMIAEVPRG